MPRISKPVTPWLEPHSIPAVRAAIDEGLAELRPFLTGMRTEGCVHEPWLGDSENGMSRLRYNAQVMALPEGPPAALRAYEVELTRIRDTLEQMEEAYRRTEGDNELLWGRV